MNDYDHMCRYAAHRDGAGFVAWLLGPQALLRFRGWHNARTLPGPGQEDRTCDTIADLESLDSTSPADRALIAEFQAQVDYDFPERALEYVGMTTRGLRRTTHPGVEVLVHVVNLTGPVQDCTITATVPGTNRVVVVSDPGVMTLRAEDARATISAVMSGRLSRIILGWVPLMHGGGEASTMGLWLEAANEEPERNRRLLLGLMARTSARLTRHRQAWDQALEGWQMETVDFWDDIRAKFKTEIRAEERAAARAEVSAEIRAAARAEERAAGELVNARATLLRLLRRRYNASVPAEVEVTVNAATNLAQLSEWTDGVLLAPTLADWRTDAGI